MIASRDTPARPRKSDFLREERVESRHDIVVADVGVRHFRLRRPVHDEQRRASLGADARRFRPSAAADIVEQIAAGGEHRAGDAGRQVLMERAAAGVRSPSRSMNAGAARSPPLPDRRAIGAGAFRADIDDVRAVGDELTRACDEPRR